LPEDYPKLTFGHVVAKDQLIWLQCRSCWREVEISARAMPQRIPHDTWFPDIAKLLRCKCGSREVSVMPEIYPGGFLGEWSRKWSPSSQALVTITTNGERGNFSSDGR